MKNKMLTIFCIIALLTGCDSTKRKNYIVLIDNSTSVPEQVMLRYITIVQETILPNIGDHDKLIVQFIDGCSQDRAERIYSFDLAEIDFTNKADGVNHKADSIRARLKHYLTVSVKDEIAKTILAKREERKHCGNYTDIINALYEAKKLVVTNKNYNTATDKLLNEAQGIDNIEYETCIVIFSDMVNENQAKTYNFTTFGRLKHDEVNKKVMELTDLDKIPDLEGVKVIVYGATSTIEAGRYAGKQIENVKLFWELFFQTTGAELKSYGYDTELELKKYIVQAE